MKKIKKLLKLLKRIVLPDKLKKHIEKEWKLKWYKR